jgi:hypothetical protein
MEIEDPRQVLRIKGKHAALFDHRRRKRIGEAAARQHGLEGFAAAFLTGAIGRNQSDQYFLAGQRMLGQIVAGDGAIVLQKNGGAGKADTWAAQTAACAFSSGRFGGNDLGFCAGESVIVRRVYSRVPARRWRRGAGFRQRLRRGLVGNHLKRKVFLRASGA